MKRGRETITILDLTSGALSNPPRVFILLEPATRIKYFTHLASGEINGLGSVEKQGNDFLIRDAFILKQRTSGARATIDPMALNRFVAECDDPEEYKFVWHSHGDISAGFSVDDIKTIRRLFGDFAINLVLNKKGEYLCRVDLFKPFYLATLVPLWVIVPVKQELISWCQKEMDSKVKEAGRLSKVARKVFGKDSRFSSRSQEKELMLLPFGELTFREGYQ